MNLNDHHKLIFEGETMNETRIAMLQNKNYVRAFGLMTPEEQECLVEVGKENLIYYDDINKWRPAFIGAFHFHLTYAIKPDYKPEPEFVDLEIVIGEDPDEEKKGVFLGVYMKVGNRLNMPYYFTHLHCLPSLPGFNQFWFTDDATGSTCKVHFSDVDNARDQGRKVFARFRA